MRALSIRQGEWKHGETDHFIFHYFRSFVAAPVAMESEFYYSFLIADLSLKKETLQIHPGKGHIFIFETEADWKRFVASAQLEEWTGAATIGNEIFVPRNPEAKFKGHQLDHELTHLLVHRYLGTQLPLWLEEGYAEDASLRGYAAYYRTKGYDARPSTPTANAYIPLGELTALKTYPAESIVPLFYLESRHLTGFLNAFGQQQHFQKLIGEMANGTSFDTALHDAYTPHWYSISDMEADFKKVACP